MAAVLYPVESDRLMSFYFKKLRKYAKKIK